MPLKSYPKVLAIGHRALAPLLGVPVYIEEKVDGSQLSFGIEDEHGELLIRSKGAPIDPEAPEKMFAPAVATILAVESRMVPGWTYRGEAVCRPKHNTLKYGRTPNGCIVIFNIDRGDGDYLDCGEMNEEAGGLGLECVPRLGEFKKLADIKIDETLETISFLGGTKIEGFVVKPIAPLFGVDGKLLVGKFVSDKFKEAHALNWKKTNPNRKDVIEALKDAYRAEARWAKAAQHMQESGALAGEPKDIGPLVRAVQADIHEECEEEIRDALYRWAKPHIMRHSTRGLPEWYKRRLAEGPPPTAGPPPAPR